VGLLVVNTVGRGHVTKEHDAGVSPRLAYDDYLFKTRQRGAAVLTYRELPGVKDFQANLRDAEIVWCWTMEAANFLLGNGDADRDYSFGICIEQKSNVEKTLGRVDASELYRLINTLPEDYLVYLDYIDAYQHSLGHPQPSCTDVWRTSRLFQARADGKRPIPWIHAKSPTKPIRTCSDPHSRNDDGRNRSHRERTSRTPLQSATVCGDRDQGKNREDKATGTAIQGETVTYGSLVSGSEFEQKRWSWSTKKVLPLGSTVDPATPCRILLVS